MWMKQFGLLCISSCLSATAFADDSCNALLEHGIYDRLVETGASSSKSAAEADLCHAYSLYEDDNKHGETAGKYYEVFSGSASYTGDQIRSIGDQMCSHSSTGEDKANYAKVDRSTISPSAVQAWQQCTANNLIATTTTFRDTDQGTEGFVLGFHLTNGGNDAKVISVDTQNINCKSAQLGPLINSSTPKQISFGLNTYAVDCTRPVKNEPFQDGVRMVYASSAHVNVVTTVGNITRDLPAILPPAPPNPVPIGAIIAWYGSASTPVPSGWAICDGTNGTPDLRDKFIKGTGDYTQVNTPGGHEKLDLPSINLAEGKTKEQAMRAENSTGIVNHRTEASNLLNSYTVPVTTDYDGPKYVRMIYIIRQR